MNSSSSFNKCPSSNLKNGRLTGLANRMLGIEQPTSSNMSTSSNTSKPTATCMSTTTSSNQQQQQPAMIPSIKRNLFGCRLDHDELHADLQQMLAEQRRVKSAQWSFDFETLRPMTGGRVEWRRVRVPVKPSNAGSPQQERDDEKYLMISTAESDDDEEHDEEEDEALAVPEFYKRQRRLKLAEVDKNRLNVLANNVNQNASNQPQKTVSNSNALAPVTCHNSGSENQMTSNKIKSSTSSINQNVKPNAVPATPIKPRASRPSRKNTHFDQLDKILTFSENRKDTLRSASASSQRQPSVFSTFKQSANSAFSQSAKKPTAVVKSSRKTNSSKINNGQDDKMRQQTLHDLEAFKQRKKRQQQLDMDANSKLKANIENTHYLRSHSTTVSK